MLCDRLSLIGELKITIFNCFHRKLRDLCLRSYFSKAETENIAKSKIADLEVSYDVITNIQIELRVTFITQNIFFFLSFFLSLFIYKLHQRQFGRRNLTELKFQ